MATMTNAEKVREKETLLMELVDAVTAKVTGHWPADRSEDVAPVRAVLERCFKLGFSVTDAEAYVECTEEYDPTLPEDLALVRMQKIASKYAPGK